MKEERQSLFQYTSGPLGESSCPKNTMVSPKSAMLHASKFKSKEGLDNKNKSLIRQNLFNPSSFESYDPKKQSPQYQTKNIWEYNSIYFLK
jgi:hypothetical protein